MYESGCKALTDQGALDEDDLRRQLRDIEREARRTFERDATDGDVERYKVQLEDRMVEVANLVTVYVYACICVCMYVERYKVQLEDRMVEVANLITM